MELSPLKNSKNAWAWDALDFYDGESKMEKLAARFKTPEIAQSFKEIFEDARISNSLLELKDSEYC